MSIPITTSITVGVETVDRIIAAAHILHAQAHGDTPWHTCQHDPCRALELPASFTRGPAPSSLPTRHVDMHADVDIDLQEHYR